MAAVRARRQSRSGGGEPPRRPYMPPPSARGMSKLTALKIAKGQPAPKLSAKDFGGMLAGAALFCGAAVAGAAFIGGSLFDAGEAFAQSADRLASTAGFTVRQIEVTGVDGARRAEIAEAALPADRLSLLSADPIEAKARIESLDWVEDATVSRMWPSTLRVDVTRRRAVARWQENGAITLIDVAGERVMAERASDRRDLPLVVGRGAGPASAEVLAALEEAPELRRRTRALVRIGDRRWNIEMKNGAVIALPERDAPGAIARLETLHAQFALLDRPVSRIDLRAAGRMAVSVNPQLAGAPYEWRRGV